MSGEVITFIVCAAVPSAVIAAVLGLRWAERHQHGRHITQTPGSRLSPDPAAWSDVPGGGDGLLGDTGVLPAGRAPRDWGASRMPSAAERTAELAAIGEHVVTVNGHPSTLDTCPGCGHSVWVSGGRIGPHDRGALTDDPCPASGSAAGPLVTAQPWVPAPQPAFTHHCPPDGEHITPCCGLKILDLEYGARVSLRDEDVTCPAARLEPLPLPDYLPAPVATHAAPDVPQAAECGPDHEYDDLPPNTDIACRDGIADGFDPADWCWRTLGHEMPHRDPVGREWSDPPRDEVPPQPKGVPDLSVPGRLEVNEHGWPTGNVIPDEPQTVTDMRAVPARVAAREHAPARWQLKAHVTHTMARKSPLREYVDQQVGPPVTELNPAYAADITDLSPAEDFDRILAEVRAGGSDG